MGKLKKAIIPAAGLGTRFLPITKVIPKPMLSVLDKPTIQFIIEELKDAEIEEIIVVVSPNSDIIKNHFTPNEQLEQRLLSDGKQSLYQMQEKMRGDFSFKEVASLKRGSVVLKGFEQLQNLSVEYPELIYDGPFSDGQDQKQIKGLNGEKITPERATEIFKSTFADYGVKEVVQVGQTNYGIECFNVQGQIDGNPAYAQISVVGGKLIMYSFAGSCKNVQITQEQATQNAKDFLQKIGLKDMQSVWENLSNNVYTINFAYTQNGVTVYPDLVKVRVCGETGMVIGLESASYYTNHTQREISKPTLTQSSAKTYLKQDLIINSVRLALVPVGNSLEVLCYEFNGNQADGEYYVYINAQNGKQVEMFKVIYSNDGSMLM